MFDLKKAVKEVTAVGNYNLDASVGSGGFGTVVKGHHIVSKTKTAIKFLDRKNGDSDALIQREVEVMSRLKHPNIVRFYEFFCLDWFVCISMEFIDGLTIQDCLGKYGVFSEKAAKDVAGQMASGISYLHEKSIMHLDIKIDNVIIRSDGIVKIIDFGYARDWELAKEMTTFPGHRLFSAPEMFRQDIFYGPSVDIWSFGIVLYVMLFGDYPFQGDGPDHLDERGRDMGLIKQILQGFGSLPEHHENLAKMSESGKRVLIQCLAGNHETRLTAQNILQSKWILNDNPSYSRVRGSSWSLSHDQFSQVIHHMKQFVRTPNATSRQILDHLQQRPYGTTSALFRMLEQCLVDGLLPPSPRSSSAPKWNGISREFMSPKQNSGDVFSSSVKETQHDRKQPSDPLRGILRPPGLKKQINSNVRFTIAKTHESRKIGDEHVVINPIRRRQPLMSATPIKTMLKMNCTPMKMTSSKMNFMKIQGTPMRQNRPNSKFQMPDTLLYYLNK